MKVVFSETDFVVNLPTGWEEMVDEKTESRLLSVKKGEETFVVFKGEFSGGAPLDHEAILKNAQENVFILNLIDFNAATGIFHFQAKSASDLPLREYYQKIVEIPGANFYWIGSCSFLLGDDSGDCDGIVSSFGLKEL